MACGHENVSCEAYAVIGPLSALIE